MKTAQQALSRAAQVQACARTATQAHSQPRRLQQLAPSVPCILHQQRVRLFARAVWERAAPEVLARSALRERTRMPLGALPAASACKESILRRWVHHPVHPVPTVLPTQTRSVAALQRRRASVTLAVPDLMAVSALNVVPASTNHQQAARRVRTVAQAHTPQQWEQIQETSAHNALRTRAAHPCLSHRLRASATLDTRETTAVPALCAQLASIRMKPVAPPVSHAMQAPFLPRQGLLQTPLVRRARQNLAAQAAPAP